MDFHTFRHPSRASSASRLGGDARVGRENNVMGAFIRVNADKNACKRGSRRRGMRTEEAEERRESDGAMGVGRAFVDATLGNGSAMDSCGEQRLERIMASPTMVVVVVGERESSMQNACTRPRAYIHHHTSGVVPNGR